MIDQQVFSEDCGAGVVLAAKRAPMLKDGLSVDVVFTCHVNAHVLFGDSHSAECAGNVFRLFGHICAHLDVSCRGLQISNTVFFQQVLVFESDQTAKALQTVNYEFVLISDVALEPVCEDKGQKRLTFISGRKI